MEARSLYIDNGHANHSDYSVEGSKKLAKPWRPRYTTQRLWGFQFPPWSTGQFVFLEALLLTYTWTGNSIYSTASHLVCHSK